ncbi:MAG: PIG-L deacetylase family protein, partial [Phycisphaerales bacterium]
MASILVIGPHPDDQEIGMGGTIALLASQGHD